MKNNAKIKKERSWHSKFTCHVKFHVFFTKKPNIKLRFHNDWHFWPPLTITDLTFQQMSIYLRQSMKMKKRQKLAFRNILMTFDILTFCFKTFPLLHVWCTWSRIWSGLRYSWSIKQQQNSKSTMTWKMTQHLVFIASRVAALTYGQ